MSQDPKPQQFEAIGAMKVKVTKSLIVAKTIVTSSRFSCPDDPHPPEFEMLLKFGETSGFLSCYFKNWSKSEVQLRRIRITLCKEEMEILMNLKSEIPAKFPEPGWGCGWGWKEFWSLQNVCKSDDEIREWKIIFSIDYDGVSTKTNFVDQYSSENDLPRDMLELLESGLNADVTLRVGGKELKAHEAILATRSTHFQRMFDSGMKESLTREIKIEEVDPAIFKEVLKFLYSGIPPKELSHMAMDLFPVADRYEISALRKMCVTAIRGILSAENVVETLIMADLHHAQDLKDVCLPVFKKNAKEIQRGESFKRLQEHPQLTIQLLASYMI